MTTYRATQLVAVLAFTFIATSASALATSANAAPDASPPPPAPTAVRTSPAQAVRPIVTPARTKPTATSRRAGRIMKAISQIKDRVWQSKMRLRNLDRALCMPPQRATRVVLMRNGDLPSPFVLLTERYELDGVVLAKGQATKGRHRALHNGPILAGNHTLRVVQVWGMRSSLFSYVRGYQVTMRASYNFYAARCQATRITTVGLSRGGVGTALVDRPTLKFKMLEIR